MKSVFRGAAALILAGALSGVCAAQDQPPMQPEGHWHGGGAVRAACQDDIAKLCGADATPGHGAFRCLRDHQDAVSDACKTAMATARAERRERHGGSDDGGTSNATSPQT